MADDALRRADQLHRTIDRHLAGAQRFAKHHLGHIDVELLRNLVRQTPDLNVARQNLEQATLILDTLGVADRMHRDANVARLGQIDPQQIDVQQVVLDGIVLPIDHHHRGALPTRDVNVEDRVHARGRKQNLVHFLRVDSHGNRVLARAVHHCRDHLLDPLPPGFVLATRGARFSGDGDVLPHGMLLLLNKQRTYGRFLMNALDCPCQ